MSKNKYKFIDLFAGCGGLSEGFLQSGKFEGVAHVEWELPMVDTLRNRLVTHWNHSLEEAKERVIHFDVQKTEELLNGMWSTETQKQYAHSNSKIIIEEGLKGISESNRTQVIIGGPPCQAYSIHGRATDKNSMQDDYRNFLFEAFVRIVDHIKPEVFVFENVPGILSARPGGLPITDRIFKAFQQIGYQIPLPNELAKDVFDTSNYGVPQNRKRVLIIGIKNDSKYELIDFYKAIKVKADVTKVSVKEAIGDLPKFFPLKEPIKRQGKNISHNITQIIDKHHVPRYHNSRDISIFKKWVTENMNYIPHKEKVEFYYQMTNKQTLYSKYRSLEWDKQSYTVVAHLHKDGLMFIHPDAKQARSITAREAAALMTFPNDYQFSGSMADWYKMIGNAVPVKFAKTVAEAIYEVLSKGN